MMTSRCLILATLLALTGCQEKPPVPLPSLPSLERPALALQVKPDALSTLTIPRPALIERGGIPGVFVLENHQARFRMVRPGKVGATRVQVLSGLHGNETLVLGDLSAVHDGSPIKTVETADKRR
jgi:predicted small lipoprotein YifL